MNSLLGDTKDTAKVLRVKPVKISNLRFDLLGYQLNFILEKGRYL